MSNTIESTYEYGIFKLMTGNRHVDPNHVKELKHEMQRNPELLATSPILVNEHYFIIDGQHRYHAAMELKRKVYYIIVEGATVDEARHLNTTQRRWTLIDFAKSFADSGRPDYKKFLEIARQYPLLPLSVVRLYCQGKQTHNTDGVFRRGDFEIPNEAEARKHLDALYAVRTLTHQNINTPMAVSLLDLMKNNDDFDVEHFLGKLEKESARELFTPVSSRRGCMRSIENVYNHQSKHMKRLY